MFVASSQACGKFLNVACIDLKMILQHPLRTERTVNQHVSPTNKYEIRGERVGLVKVE